MFDCIEESASVAGCRERDREVEMNRAEEEQRLRKVKVETGETRERAPVASGLYFPRHSDFILATNKERAFFVSMVTPPPPHPLVQEMMERIKGQEREYILASGKTFFFTSLWRSIIHFFS